MAVRRPLSVLLPLAVAVIAAGCSSVDAIRPIILGELDVQKSGVNLVPANEFNSSADDFGLTMPLDSTIVFLTSSRAGAAGKHSVFTSRRENGVWGQPELAVAVNNGMSNGVPMITPGGETMYFTGCDYGLGDCDLYRVNSGPRGAVPERTVPWTIPANMGLPINGPYWDSQPTIAADGSVIYFSSDRPGGIGGKDLWYSRRQLNGEWSPPVNAGEEINTSFDEVTPWLSPDNQTLTFSSNGHPGLGGFDIFVIPVDAQDVQASNMGTPINSAADEISFSLSADGTKAFVASNRKGGLGGYDIYRVDPVPIVVDPVMIVKGRVLAADGAPILGTVDVVDLRSSKSVGSFSTDPATGRFAVILPRGRNYAITAQGANFLFMSRQVDVPWNLEETTTRAIDFELQPINGVIRLLVFFEPGQALLERESASDLDRVADLLTYNKTYRIEIAGHTDNIGEPEVNVELSKARAQAVKSYLVGNRIPADRIDAVGYGASQPIATNDNEDGRALNRRVELRMIIPQ